MELNSRPTRTPLHHTHLLLDLAQHIEERRFHRMFIECRFPRLRIVEILIANVNNLREENVDIGSRRWLIVHIGL